MIIAVDVHLNDAQNVHFARQLADCIGARFQYNTIICAASPSIIVLPRPFDARIIELWMHRVGGPTILVSNGRKDLRFDRRIPEMSVDDITRCIFQSNL